MEHDTPALDELVIHEFDPLQVQMVMDYITKHSRSDLTYFELTEIVNILVKLVESATMNINLLRRLKGLPPMEPPNR